MNQKIDTTATATATTKTAYELRFGIWGQGYYESGSYPTPRILKGDTLEDVRAQMQKAFDAGRYEDKTSIDNFGFRSIDGAMGFVRKIETLTAKDGRKFINIEHLDDPIELGDTSDLNKMLEQDDAFIYFLDALPNWSVL